MPNLPGHIVQRQPLHGAATPTHPAMPITGFQIENNWGLPPLIHGRIKVIDYDPDNYLWTYEILEGDKTTLPSEYGFSEGAPGSALTGCMKLFRDVTGTEHVAGFGWNCKGRQSGVYQQTSKAEQTERVLDGKPGIRMERIKFTQTSVDSSGNTIKQFYFKVLQENQLLGLNQSFISTDGVNRGGLATLDTNWDFNTQGPQIIYTYGGPQNVRTSPWFYVPTTGTTDTMEPIQKLWSMYTYSGWVGMK